MKFLVIRKFKISCC